MTQSEREIESERDEERLRESERENGTDSDRRTKQHMRRWLQQIDRNPHSRTNWIMRMRMRLAAADEDDPEHDVPSPAACLDCGDVHVDGLSCLLAKLYSQPHAHSTGPDG